MFRNITKYDEPRYGDFVVRKRFFGAKYGVVNGYSKDTGMVSVIFENTPRILFTMTQDEMDKVTEYIPLGHMQQWKNGRYYVMQEISGRCIWYV